MLSQYDGLPGKRPVLAQSTLCCQWLLNNHYRDFNGDQLPRDPFHCIETACSSSFTMLHPGFLPVPIAAGHLILLQRLPHVSSQCTQAVCYTSIKAPQVPYPVVIYHISDDNQLAIVITVVDQGHAANLNEPPENLQREVLGMTMDFHSKTIQLKLERKLHSSSSSPQQEAQASLRPAEPCIEL
jgi:hypothetical protein